MTDHVKVEILKALRLDERFRRLPAGARDQLAACVVGFGVGPDGRFWAKNETVATLVDTTDRSVRENFRKAEAVGLLARIDWYHDVRGGRVSNTFEVDSALIPLHLLGGASDPIARPEAEFRAPLLNGPEAEFRPKTEETLYAPKKGRAADAATRDPDLDHEGSLDVLRSLASRYGGGS